MKKQFVKGIAAALVFLLLAGVTVACADNQKTAGTTESSTTAGVTETSEAAAAESEETTEPETSADAESSATTEDTETSETTEAGETAATTEANASAVQSLDVNFSAAETAAMSDSMNLGQYVIDGNMVYGQGYSTEGQPCLASFEISPNGAAPEILHPQIILEQNSSAHVQLIDGQLYFLVPDPSGQFDYRAIYSVPKENGNMIPITDRAVDYFQYVGDKLYFTDADYHLYCAAVNGENPVEIVAKKIAYPYVFNTDWLVYQDVEDGQALHLMYLPTGEDLVICDKPSFSPVIAENYLYFVCQEGQAQHLARVDLNAIEATPQDDGTFSYNVPTETSDKNVATQFAITADGHIFVGGAQSWELAQWTEAENPDGVVTEIVKASSADYAISWVLDAAGNVDHVQVTDLKTGGVTPVPGIN